MFTSRLSRFRLWAFRLWNSISSRKGVWLPCWGFGLYLCTSIISWPYCRAFDQMELAESHKCGLLNSPSKHFAAFSRLKLIYGVSLRHRSPQLRNDVLMDIFCCSLETVNCTLKDNCECNKISRRLTQITDRSIALLLALPKHIALRILEMALMLLFVESSCPLRSAKSDHELETLGTHRVVFQVCFAWGFRGCCVDKAVICHWQLIYIIHLSLRLFALFMEKIASGFGWVTTRWCHDVAAHRRPNESRNCNCTMTSMGFHLKRITLRTQRDNKAVPAQEFPINRWFLWVLFVGDVRGA